MAVVRAAAAVTAVVAASLAISTTFHGHRRGTGPAPVAPSNGSPAEGKGLLRLAPPYFVELTDLTQEHAQKAVVRSTVTGHTLATVTPPPPFNVFTWVSGAADDRTLVPECPCLSCPASLDPAWCLI